MSSSLPTMFVSTHRFVLQLGLQMTDARVDLYRVSLESDKERECYDLSVLSA